MNLSHIKLAGWAALVLTFALCPPAALAHAKLLRSQPTANAALKQAPKSVELWFSESLEADGCNVVVTDQTGKRVDRQNVGLAEGGKKLQTELEDLASGAYTVEWRALSTDGHTMKGKFTFTVAPEGVGTVAPSSTSSGSQTAGPPAQSQPQAAQQTPAAEGIQESGTTWTMSLIRWLEYLAMVTLAGGFAFRLMILGPVLRGAQGLEPGERATALSASARQFIKLSWWALLLLALTALAALVLQTSAVVDTGLVESLSPARLYQVLTRTSYGGPWLLQAAAIAVLAFVLFLLTRRIRNTDYERHLSSPATPGLLWAGVIVTALMMLAPSLTGHARAATQYHFTVFSDWLHLVAAGFWVGGLFHLALTMTRGVSGLQGGQRLRVLERAIPLFTKLAIVSTVVIALTGLYNSWVHVDRLSALWSTPYGRALSVKITLFIVMVALGGLNTFVIHPKVKRLIEGGGGTAAHEHLKLNRSFYRAVGLEAALGIVVLLAAAVLAFLQPVREHPTDMTQTVTPDSTNMQGSR